MADQAEFLEFCIEDDEAGERLDKALAGRLADLSRTQIQGLIKDGKVRVNDQPSKPAYRLEPGDCVSVELSVESETEVLPEHIALEVIYEDSAIAVINKPAGMVVHPARGNKTGTLVNAILARWPHISNIGDDPERSGLVHRLDKDTSGLMVVALTDEARANLIAQFQSRHVEKHYLALVEHHPPNDRGRIEAPIGRDPRHRKRMAVLHDGKEAVTEFYVRDFYGDYALLDVYPYTGRTHQIRVHLAFIRCPVVGDQVYGARKPRLKLKRLFLHAYQLSLDHPATGQRLLFEVPLPVGLQNILDKLAQ
jgi:23S rRNA pseudouridine1911/1915/1917 synthase